VLVPEVEGDWKRKDAVVWCLGLVVQGVRLFGLVLRLLEQDRSLSISTSLMKGDWYMVRNRVECALTSLFS